MRTIPIFLISCIGLLAACTTEPDRPDDTPPPPAPVCAETCEQDSQCAQGGVCSGGACVDPCGPANPCEAGVCTEGKCVPGCAADADCAGNAAGEFCTPAGVCGECLADLDCKGNAAGTMCGSAPTTPGSAATTVCKCAGDNECAGAGPGLGLCRAEGCVCSSDAGCPTGAQKCESGICIACSTDAHCAANDDGDDTTPNPSKCFAGDSVGAYCGCATNDECGEGLLCEVESGTCVPCLTDAECGEAPNNVCVGAGTAAAKCGCGEGSCTDGLVCDAATGKCVAPANTCTSDADCASSGYGSTCDLATGVCSCADDSSCTAPTTGTTWVCQ